MLSEVSVLHCDNSPARGRGQKGAGEVPCEQMSCVMRSIPLLPRRWKWLLFLLIFFSMLCQDHVVASLKHTSDINPLFRLNYWYEVAGKQTAACMHCSTDILSWASRCWTLWASAAFSMADWKNLLCYLKNDQLCGFHFSGPGLLY